MIGVVALIYELDNRVYDVPNYEKGCLDISEILRKSLKENWCLPI